MCQSTETKGDSPTIPGYLWLDFESAVFISLCKGFQGNLRVGALAHRRQKVLLQARFVEDPPPPARSFVYALSHLVNRVVFRVVQPATNEAISGLCMDVVAGERSFSAGARPSKS